MPRSLLLFSLISCLCPASLKAQDPFEIQVYEYETAPKGKWDLEAHTNFIFSGVKTPEGSVSPTHHQFHHTYELTRGITEDFELAGYLVLSRRAGINSVLEYGGWRVRPRFKVPERINLPVKLSFAIEVGFLRRQYEDNPVTLELRPIIEKSFGKWQFDFNPTIARALRGPGTQDGFEFEPAVRVGLKTSSKLDLTAEYYGGTGPFRHFLPSHEQLHQFYPGFDYQIGENLIFNAGIGFAATPAGSQLVFKTRIGWIFGGSRKN